MHHTIWTSLCAQHKVHVNRTDSRSQTAQSKAKSSQGATHTSQVSVRSCNLLRTQRRPFRTLLSCVARSSRSLQLGQTGVTRGVLLIQPFVNAHGCCVRCAGVRAANLVLTPCLKPVTGWPLCRVDGGVRARVSRVQTTSLIVVHAVRGTQ